MRDPSILTMIVGLFAMTGPISGLPVFITATKGQTTEAQHRTILIIAATYVIACFVSLFAGHAVLESFGVSVAGLRVAGK